jgi:MFS family permease
LTAAASTSSRLAALSSPLYRRFWLGSLASVGATQLVMMGQSWLVFELSGSAGDLAILGAAASLPTILITLAGGVLADRMDRRRLMLMTTPAIALVLAALTVLDASDRAEVWHVWTLAALFAAVSGFDWPARQAIFTALIDRSQMLSAVALNSVLWQGTRMVMPGLGGLMVAAWTTASVFAAATVGFLVMLVVLLRLPPTGTPAAGARSWQSLKDGLGFVAGTPLFAVLIPLTYVTMFFGNSYLQIMPLFADRLGTGAEGFGMLVSASGLGSILGTVLVSGRPHQRHLGRIMLGGACAAALSQLGFAAVTLWIPDHPLGFITAALLVTLTAAFSSAFLITSMTALQLFVPDAMRGRVMSLHGITFSLMPLGALFSGGLATIVGAPVAVAIGAAVVLVVVLWAWATRAEVRELAPPVA